MKLAELSQQQEQLLQQLEEQGGVIDFEEIPENVVGKCGLFEPEGFGFADAFLSPPHGMTGSSLELNTLFLNLADHFFASFTDAGQIYTWSDDCSNYFDAGKEWWGTLFYTYF